MKKLLAFLGLLVLAACASPTMKMSDQQIVSLSDDQLCSYKNNYREESRLNAELARRGLGGMECNRFYRECLRRGNQPGTQPMFFCMDTLKENERLRDRMDRYDDRAFLYGYPGYYHSGVGVGLGF
jgi:hypothetical protein